jgi:hypothetical protein
LVGWETPRDGIKQGPPASFPDKFGMDCRCHQNLQGMSTCSACNLHESFTGVSYQPPSQVLGTGPKVTTSPVFAVVSLCLETVGRPQALELLPHSMRRPQTSNSSQHPISDFSRILRQPGFIPRLHHRLASPARFGLHPTPIPLTIGNYFCPEAP